LGRHADAIRWNWKDEGVKEPHVARVTPELR